MAALITEQSGPSELLTSGVLPENIFKSLGSQVLEIVGGAEGFGEAEGGEPVGVKIIDIASEIGTTLQSLEEQDAAVKKGLVQELIDDIKSLLDTLFGGEEKKKKK
jgi:hypothetical protein